MISGDTDRRNFTCAVPEPPKSLWSGFELTQPALQQKALGFNCLNYGGTPEPSLGRHYLPDKSFIDANCPDGLRLELMFPSCWNGKDTDSPDHRSHVVSRPPLIWFFQHFLIGRSGFPRSGHDWQLSSWF